MLEHEKETKKGGEKEREEKKGGEEKKGRRKEKKQEKNASPGIEPRTFRVVGQNSNH